MLILSVKISSIPKFNWPYPFELPNFSLADQKVFSAGKILCVPIHVSPTWERESRDQKITRDIAKTKLQTGERHVTGREVKSAPRRISLLVLAVATIRGGFIHEHQPPCYQLTFVLTTDFIIVHFKHREGSELSEAVTRRAGRPRRFKHMTVYSGTSYFLHSSNHRRCCNEVRSKD